MIYPKIISQIDSKRYNHHTSQEELDRYMSVFRNETLEGKRKILNDLQSAILMGADRLLFLKENLTRAKNRKDKKFIDIDLTDLYHIGFIQEWKCALSNVNLEFTRGGQMWDGKWANPNSCSIDRIDSSIGYIPSNIQLVTWKINKTKGSMKNQEFIDLCTHVASTNHPKF